MSLQEQLQEQLKQAVNALHISPDGVEVTVSKDSQHGEYTTNVALLIAKELGKTSMEMADELASMLSSNEKVTSLAIEKVEVVKPGFINFFVRKEFLLQQVADLLEGKKKIAGVDKKVIVELCSSEYT